MNGLILGASAVKVKSFRSMLNNSYMQVHTCNVYSTPDGGSCTSSAVDFHAICSCYCRKRSWSRRYRCGVSALVCGQSMAGMGIGMGGNCGIGDGQRAQEVRRVLSRKRRYLSNMAPGITC